MQSSSIVTRCPHCKTAFRVSRAQMNAAKGAVRCGSCLSIFRAEDHEVIEDKTTTSLKSASSLVSKSQAIKKKPIEKKPENTFSLDVDEELLQDNDAIDNAIEQESDDFYFFDKETPTPDKKSSIFGTTTTKPVTESTQEKADESWALDILAELEDGDDDEALIQNAPKHNQTRQEEPAKPQHQDTPETTSTKTTAFEIEPEEDNFTRDIEYEAFDEEDGLGDLSFEAEPSSNTRLESNDEVEDLEFYYNEKFEVDEADEVQEHKQDYRKEPIADGFDEDLESLISDDEIDHAIDAKPSYRQELQGMIRGIQSAPVEMGMYESEAKRKWLWRVALVLVVLALAIQLLYFRFDSLAKHPTYRPILSHACNVIGCQLPEWVAIDQIRSNNLIVRSHPTVANALLVDVILINNANFEQVYPALSLEFTTLGDSIVAASQIQPNEYLRGELAGSRLMPIKQPIQISLTIEDPGDTAVNYQLNILSAKP